MANPDLIKQGKDIGDAKRLMKLKYVAIKDEVALADIQNHLGDLYNQEYSAALMHGRSDAFKSAVALQRASAYAEMQSYINDMLA